MAMPVNMILVMYVILCILSYDFNKLTLLYIHVHISISMTNKSGLTFFLSIKYLSVCLSVCLVLNGRPLIVFLEVYSRISIDIKIFYYDHFKNIASIRPTTIILIQH